MTASGRNTGSRSAAVDLTRLDQEVIDWIRRQTASNGHMAFRDQHLSPADLERFVGRLGRLMFTPGERPLPGHRYVFEVTNRHRTTKPKSVFYSDTSYVADPPSFTALAAVEVPHRGGATLIVDQYATDRCAPPDLVELMAGLELLHIPTRVGDPDDAGDGAWHPVQRRHPLTGRRSLFLSARERLAGSRRHGIVHTDADAHRLIDRIHIHATTSVPPHVHEWAKGDVLLIDNRCTLHAADHSQVEGHRTLHRVMCADPS
ncbi:MAG: TauD/TfdA family dioxygenase [Acidobacteriota bacterium]